MVSMPWRLGPGFSGGLQVAAGGIPCIILDRRRVRKSASGDLSETRRGIQFLKPEESAHVSRSSLLLRMELRSNPEMLCVVRNALGQLAATLGFSEPDCHAVVLAVDEALTNIIRHAYLGDLQQPIEASFRRIQVPRDGKSEDALEIALADSGVPAASQKTCGRAKMCGRGAWACTSFVRAWIR